MPKKNVRVKTVENKKQLTVQLLLALVFVYVFASLAIDSGSYWHYILTFVSIGIAVNAGGRISKDVFRNYVFKNSK